MTLSPRRAASYRLSLRLLLSPARLRESLTTLQPQPSLRNATIAGAQVALALVLIAAALHPSPGSTCSALPVWGHWRRCSGAAPR